MPFAKTECPISRDHFRAHAKGIVVNILGQNVLLAAKEFSTGSFGWHAGEKILVDVGGTKVRVQLGINLTVVGSKPQE
jgi:hypothetical protein